MSLGIRMRGPTRCSAAQLSEGAAADVGAILTVGAKLPQAFEQFNRDFPQVFLH